MNSCGSNGSACGPRCGCVAGRALDIPTPGDYVVTEIGRESIIVVRQADGGVRAFYNVCQHRGNRLRPAAAVPPGSAHRSSVPTITGNTTSTVRTGASPTSTPSRKARRQHGLREVKCDEWGSFVWFSMNPEAEPLAEFLRPDPGAPRSVSLRAHGADPRHHGRMGLQLEDLRRCLQRELPRAGHPSAAAVVPARSRHPDRLLRAPQPLPHSVRHALAARAQAAGDPRADQERS